MGQGGAFYNSQSAVVLDSTFFANIGSGGAGGDGSIHTRGGNGGLGYGGALFNVGTLAAISIQGSASLLNCTIAGNRATGGSPNGSAFGAGLATTGAVVMLKNVILAHAPGGSNVFGTVIDAGHNLSSDGSGGFTAPTSLSNVDPRLGMLTDAGGPTLSIPLWGSSPAIDAGDGGACPPTDRDRDFRRQSKRAVLPDGFALK